MTIMKYYIILKIITKILSMTGLKYDLLYTLKVTSILPYLFILIISPLKLKKEYSWLTVGLFTFALGTMCDFFIHFIHFRFNSFFSRFPCIGAAASFGVGAQSRSGIIPAAPFHALHDAIGESQADRVHLFADARV